MERVPLNVKNIITTFAILITIACFGNVDEKADKEKYGAIMNVISIYQNSWLDTWLIWITPAIITQVKELWEATRALTMRTSKWHGWLLTYLTKNCLDSFDLLRSKLTPYKNKFINTIPAIASKLGITRESIYESSDIKDIFFDHDPEKLLVTTIYNNFQQEVQSTHEYIILYQTMLN